MKLDIKKLLLAGTAIVAVGATSVTAQAATATLAGDIEWASGAAGTVDGNGTTASAGHDAVMTTHQLTFTNDGVNNDGSANTNTFAAGAVTSTTGNLIIEDDTGANLAVTLGSFTSSSTGDFSVLGKDANTANITANVTGALNTGGTLNVVNVETSSADVLALNVGGALTVEGATTLTAGAFAGATSAITVTGNSSFKGAVTVTGGAGAGSNATLTLNGATNAFTGGLTLATAANSNLTLSGSTAQTVSGNITGAGAINVANASGATFSGTVGGGAGTVVIENGAAALASSATFQNTVNVTSITLGAAGTGVNTVTFDTATQAFTATGTVAGAIAGEENNIVVSGGKTLTQASDWTTNLDKITVSGTGTVLDSNAILGATDIVVGSGAKLDQGAGAINANIANSGTIQSTAGAATITGDITGTGALDIDAAQTVAGKITQGSADIAAVTLTHNTGDTYNVGTTTFSADGTVAFDNAARTITGNFTNTTDGEGTITVADGTNTTAFVGNLGASTSNSLKALTVAGGGANVVTATGNLYVDAITLNDADTLSFIGTSAQTVSGTITDGILNVGDGTKTTDVTFGGVIASAVTQNVQAKATARYNANATFTGAYTNAGTTEVGSGSTLTAASLTDSGGTFVLDVTDADGTLTAADFGQISVGAAALDTDDVSINVTGFIGTANDIDIAGAATFDDAKALTDNSALYVFTVDAANQVDVTEVAVATITNNAGQVATAQELLNIGSGATGELEQVQNAFVSAGNGDVAKVAEAAASDVSGGAVVAGVQVAGSTSAINNDRLASLRSGETGMNAGQVMHGLNAWIQGFGSQGQQDERDGVSGYDADTYGFAVGFDTQELAQDITVGLSFAYADTEVDSDAISNANTEVDSYQISLYGDYDLNETVFVSGQLGYIWSDNDTTRNPGGLSALSAKGSYNADAFVAGLAVGRDYHTGHGTLVLTPKLSADYMHYSADSYTETGAGTANLSVDSESLNMFEIGLGVEAEWDIQNANGSHLMPSIGLGVRHDLIGDEFEATNKFANAGSTAFKVKGFDPAQTTFDAGLGVKYITDTNWTLSAGYNFEFKSDYDSHAGMVKASYKF